MGVEIERKYLVDEQVWEKADKGERHFVKQGYIGNTKSKTIRIRITDNKGYITIKGISTGASRPEFEYEIPPEDAKQLLDNFCESTISKIRSKVYFKSKLWEVDEFLEDNNGLIIAEIELSSDDEKFDLPNWIVKEVTGEEKYYNAYLSIHPYKGWEQ